MSRCEKCEMIPLIDITSPVDYAAALQSFAGMVTAKEMEIVYQSFPIELLLRPAIIKKYKFFHQFRCKTCGTIYGMFMNTRAGGQIKINDKVFNPADYPDPKKAEENTETESDK